MDRASVVVQFIEGHSIIKFGKKNVTRWELRTNQEGIARIPTIPQGKVRVQVIAKGYQTSGAVYDVNEEEKTIVVKLNPPQPQYSAPSMRALTMAVLMAAAATAQIPKLPDQLKGAPVVPRSLSRKGRFFKLPMASFTSRIIKDEPQLARCVRTGLPAS